MPRMLQRKVVVASLLLAGMVAGGILLGPCYDPRVTLADGSHLTLRSVTVGKQSSHYYGSSLSRLARKLPAPFRNWLPQGVALSVRSETPNATFWMDLDRAFLRGQRARFQFLLEDDAGAEFEVPAEAEIQLCPNGNSAVYVSTATWPRSEKRFRLRIFDESLTTPSRLAGQWVISNPAVVPRAAWATNPPALPSSQHLENANVTLDQFEVRPMPTSPARFWRSGRPEEPGAYLKLSQSNPPSSDSPSWRLLDVRFIDPDDNRSPSGNIERRGPTQGWILVSRVKLPSTRQCAYQVETVWQSNGPYRPGELTNVTATISDSIFQSRVAQGRFNECEFEIHATQGGTSAEPGWTLRAWKLQARSQVLNGDHLRQATLVEAFDHAGRRWIASPNAALELPGNATNVTVVLAVRDLKIARFTAQPVYRTNSPPRRVP